LRGYVNKGGEIDALFLPQNVHFLQEILCDFDLSFIIDSDKKFSIWRKIKMYRKLKMIMASGSILGYFLQVVPITIFVGIVYCVIRLILIKKKDKPILWGKEFVRLIFVCYVTGLFNLLVMPANFWLFVMDGIAFGWWSEIPSIFSIGEFNFIPSIIQWMQGNLSIGSWVKHMLIGNIAMFMPLGFLLPFVTEKISKKNIWKIAIFVPLAAELLQLVLGRSFDIDDLICNFVGIVIGFLIAKRLF
jgi:glycopeptide antibiotics resistance protein